MALPLSQVQQKQVFTFSSDGDCLRANSEMPSSFSSKKKGSALANSFAGNFFNDSGQSELAERRLTRQRKLRYATDQELGLNNHQVERSRSSPASPESARKSRSPNGGSDHWSSTAVPHPLPLPESLLIRRPNSTGSEGFCSPFERKNPNQISINPSKTSSKCQRRFSEDAIVGTLRPNLGLSFPVTPVVDISPSHVPSSSSNYSNSHHRGLSQAANTECDYSKVNVPSRSAPSSVYSSPAVSPRRSNAGNISPSYFPHQEFEFYDTRPRCSSCKVSPKKNAYSADHTPRYSPATRNIFHNPKCPKGSFPLHQKSLSEASVERRESNGLVNSYPLPLPPGATTAPYSPTVHHKPESPSFGSSMKGQWQKGKLIGRGTFGSVYEATNRETGAMCAMKEVDLIPDDPKSAECIKQLEQEIKVLRQLKHPNIVQYYGSEIIDDHFYIYLEYVHPGSINKFVREYCGAVTESVVRHFTRHILSGLAFLHGKKTIHRDIKGANLLVDSSGVVKLADFGMAKHLTGHCYELSLKGSPYWMAPEVIRAVIQKDADPDLALAVDIWSLGCTIIEMLNGRPPWSEFNGPQAMFKALNRTPPVPETLSSEGKDFLSWCFRRNPAERPSANDLLDHPFVRNSHDQHVSAATHNLSAMNLMDKSHCPDRTKHKTDFMSYSPRTRTTSPIMQYNGNSSSSWTLTS